MLSRDCLTKIAVDLKAHSLGAFFRGGDDDAAVAGTEIVDQIAFFDTGELDHFVDDLLRRRHEGHDLFVFEDGVLGNRDGVLRVLRDDGESR